MCIVYQTTFLSHPLILKLSWNVNKKYIKIRAYEFQYFNLQPIPPNCEIHDIVGYIPHTEGATINIRKVFNKQKAKNNFLFRKVFPDSVLN